MLMVTETCPTCGDDLDGDNAAGGLCRPACSNGQSIFLAP